MLPNYVNEEYHIFNASTRFSAYGYIYYASLYASESYAISVFLVLLALIGVATTVLMFVMHICAICFAYHHFYRSVHIPLGSTTVRRKPCRNPFSCGFRRISRSLLSRCQGMCCACCPGRPKSPVVHTGFSTSFEQNTTTIVKIPKLLVTGNTTTPTCTTATDVNIFPFYSKTVPGVSIIKPLTGIDINLEINLTSYFMLEYPKYEILFCVPDESDPACDLVRQLQSSYPHVNSRLIFAKDEVGVNPKINNLQAGYLAAQFDLILISDAGIWMRSDTLTDMVATLLIDPTIGMVHQVPFLTPHLTNSVLTACKVCSCKNNLSKNHGWTSQTSRPSFAWIVQLVFFGCWHAKISLCAALLGINCTTGMSCLLRKSILNDVNGFKPFACYLAEDFFLAKYLLDNGWYVRVAHQPAWQNSPSTSLHQFRTRLSRWSQLRLSMVVVAYFLEPFSRCLPNALFGAFGFSYIFPDFVDPGVYFLCHMLIWFLLDYILLLQIYPPCVPLCITRLEYLIAWIFSEVTAVPYHFSAIFKKELHWRNKRFRIHWGGLAEHVHSNPLKFEPILEQRTLADKGDQILSMV